MERCYDVAIAGGGVIGSAVAYFLAAEAAFDGSVVVVERDPSYESCATTRSWGGIRQQFSTPENVRMSLFGADFVKRAAALLSVEGAAPDLGFRERGYLFLAREAGLATLERNGRLQRSLGAKVAVLPPDALKRRFSWLEVGDLAGGALGLENEGWFDPSALLHGLRRKARALGAVYLTDEVVGIGLRRGRVESLRLRAGGRLGCRVLVNAAGPQAGRLARLAGAALPVCPRKRTTFVFDCKPTFPDMPLIIDISGVAVRPEGAHYIAIVSPPEDRDRDADDLDLEPEYALFDEVIWPALAHRVPAFEAIKLTGAWAGHYDYNTFDRNAILGRHPEIEGLLFCNGFSGHGLQQAPAAGRAIAELIVFGAYRSLDLANLSYARVLEGRPVRETNVV
ncbi:MAG: NAD(P)/FAD-dependent oxidoreductase [Kiloniellaceae bacterium]